eukprot:scaffold26_cov397-Pavlova_lutheri.AAC.14
MSSPLATEEPPGNVRGWRDAACGTSYASTGTPAPDGGPKSASELPKDKTGSDVEWRRFHVRPLWRKIGALKSCGSCCMSSGIGHLRVASTNPLSSPVFVKGNGSPIEKGSWSLSKGKSIPFVGSVSKRMATAMASPGRKIALFDVDGTLTQPRKVREESYGSHAKDAGGEPNDAEVLARVEEGASARRDEATKPRKGRKALF